MSTDLTMCSVFSEDALEHLLSKWDDLFENIRFVPFRLRNDRKCSRFI